MKMLTPKNYLKVLNRKHFSSGFTLVETMLAASFTSVVIGAAGFGLVNLLSSNQTANASSDIQYDLNRAVEFISDEIKGANRIGTNTIGTGFDDESGARKAVLVLEMPQVDENNNPVRVVYYTRAKADEKISKTPWQGPQILYRWGPNFDADGQYEMNDNDGDKINEIPAPMNGTTVVWQYEPLIDLIADDIDADKKQCNNTGTGWTRSPVNDADVKGFFVCLNSDLNLVELHAHSSAKLNNKDTVSYEIATEVFVRSESTTSTTSTGVSPSIIFQTIGGATTCGKGGSPVPITTNIYLSKPDGTLYDTKTLAPNTVVEISNPPKGVKVKVESIAQKVASCFGNKANSEQTSSPRVKVLKNGDSVPNITPFNKQNTIKSFLQPYIDKGKIKIGDDQVIYLFEHGSAFTDLEDYDLQDNVVLATIPKTDGDSSTSTTSP